MARLRRGSNVSDGAGNPARFSGVQRAARLLHFASIRRIVSGTGDNTANIWDIAGGKELLTLKGHTREIRAIAFSPDGLRILTASWDNTAKVWEAVGGKELLTLRHSTGIESTAFSPDGQRIVTGGRDNTATVWEAASGRQLLTLKGHSGFISAVAFSPDGQRILTGSWDTTAKVWEAVGGKEMLSPRALLTKNMRRLPEQMGHARELFTLKGHSGVIISVTFSPDGLRILTGSWDGTARVWEAATLAQVERWHAQEEAAAEHLAALERERQREHPEQLR